MRCKPSKVSVIIVEDISKGIPKGKYWKELAHSQRIVVLEVYRFMSPLQVKKAILKAFSHLPLHTFQYLVCCDKTTLVLNSNQTQDGNTIINSIQAVKGSLYILECKESAEVSFHFYVNHLNYSVHLQDTGDDNIDLPPGPTAVEVVDLTEQTSRAMVRIVKLYVICGNCISFDIYTHKTTSIENISIHGELLPDCSIRVTD